MQFTTYFTTGLASWVAEQQSQLLAMALCIDVEGSRSEREFVRCSNVQGEFEKKWQKEVTNKLTDAANATRAEERAAVRASTEAAQVPLLYEPWLATSFRGCSGALLRHNSSRQHCCGCWESRCTHAAAAEELLS